MSFSTSLYPLSSLIPVKLGYNFNTKEEFEYDIVEYSNTLSYYKYSAFENLQDVALSNKTALFLTDTMPVSNVFVSTESPASIGQIAGTFYLRDSINFNYLYYTGNTIVAGTYPYDKLLISLVPLENGLVELHTNEGTKITIDSAYPYTAYTTKDQLPPNQLYRQQFEVEYYSRRFTFKTNTVEGPRYLSYGADGVVRAVGTMFNNAVLNSYIFTAAYITTDSLSLGYKPTTSEVKYYNNIETFVNKLNVEIETSNTNDTNLLITCSTSEITSEDETQANIALLKSNFTSTGTYLPYNNE